MYRMNLMKLVTFLALAIALGLFFFKERIQLWQNTEFVNPWTEFEEVSEVIISSHLFEFGSIADSIVNAAEGQKIKVTILEDSNSILENWPEKKASLSQAAFLKVPHSGVWIRDFAPLNIKKSNALNTKTQLKFADFEYLLEPTLDDQLPNYLSQSLQIPLLKIPIKLDGGNIIATSSDCFLSDDFISANNNFQSHLQLEGIDEIKKDLGETLGCRINLISNAPHPHVDMYLKAINEHVLLVSEISDDLILYLRKLDYPDIRNVEQVKDQLNRVVEQIPPQFKIVRIPMPAPSLGLFRNYTNSILLGKSVLMPSYRKSRHISGFYIDQEILEGLESRARLAYESLGLKVMSIDADKIISAGGALHCVALTIPQQRI